MKAAETFVEVLKPDEAEVKLLETREGGKTEGKRMDRQEGDERARRISEGRLAFPALDLDERPCPCQTYANRHTAQLREKAA